VIIVSLILFAVLVLVLDWKRIAVPHVTFRT
jgi:hypothetical protein